MAAISVLKNVMNDLSLAEQFSIQLGLMQGIKILEKNEKKPEKAWKACFEKAGPQSTVFLIGMALGMLNWPTDKEAVSLINKGDEIIGKKSLDSKTEKWFKTIKRIVKITQETKSKKVLSQIFKPKEPLEQIELLEMMVKKTAWNVNPGQRKAIDKAEKKLEKMPLKEAEKEKIAAIKVVDVAIQNFNKKAQNKQENPISEKHPVIYTARITNKETCKKLQAICKEWKKKAQLKADVANAPATQSMTSAKKALAFDSSQMASLFADLEGTEITSKHDALYVAYDSTMKLQAIASVKFSKKQEQELSMLCSNPDNIAVLGDEIGPVRGAGSSIIRHISQDILDTSKYKKKVLTLTALSTAEAFYKKIGFKENKKNDEFVLKEDKMKTLLQKKSEKHVMQKVEPTADKLSA